MENLEQNNLDYLTSSISLHDDCFLSSEYFKIYQWQRMFVYSHDRLNVIHLHQTSLIYNRILLYFLSLLSCYSVGVVCFLCISKGEKKHEGYSGMKEKNRARERRQL